MTVYVERSGGKFHAWAYYSEGRVCAEGWSVSDAVVNLCQKAGYAVSMCRVVRC